MSKEDLYDTLGERMKAYEAVTTSQPLMPLLPLYARIDGRHFSSFTRGLGMPYPDLKEKCGYEMAQAMQKTAEALCKEFHCCLVETHSDEISLAWESLEKAPFEGRLFKLVSNLASYAGVMFYHFIHDLIPDKIAKGQFPSFDCRVFQVPDMMELANLFVWRQNDCMRGCLNQYAQQVFSHKQLMNKTCEERKAMLVEAGHDFDKVVNDVFKYGYFCYRGVVDVPVDPKYFPDSPEEATVPRTRILKKDVSFPISKVANIIDFLFSPEKTKVIFKEDVEKGTITK